MTIKEIRDHYDLTQAQLSQITGIPARTIGNWETGNRKPADYIPALVEAAVEQYISNNNGGTDMAEFNLGLEQCRARERAEGAYADYIIFCRKNNIELTDKANPVIKNADELWNMNTAIDKCKNEEDIRKVKERIAALRALVK